MAVRYFDRDFDWDAYERDVVPSLSLPPITQAGAQVKVEKSELFPSESKENDSPAKGESEKQRRRGNKKRESRKKIVSDAAHASTETSGAGHEWDSFFAQHTTGAMYKPRRYIHNEFRAFFDELLAMKDHLTLLEVGCGYGCTMFPLLENFLPASADTSAAPKDIDNASDCEADTITTGEDTGTDTTLVAKDQMETEECEEIASKRTTRVHYFATDYAAVALDILRSNSLCTRFSSCFETALWDVTLPPPAALVQRECDAVLAVFALSAVSPHLHLASLQHIFGLLAAANVSYGGNETKKGINAGSGEEEEERRKKKFVFFRDYGLHDMTMYRHTKRLDECTFERQDGTICYYFSIEYMRTLAEKVGFTVREIDYATVINRNRKTNQALHRVFLHAVLEIEV